MEQALADELGIDVGELEDYLEGAESRDVGLGGTRFKLKMMTPV